MRDLTVIIQRDVPVEVSVGCLTVDEAMAQAVAQSEGGHRAGPFLLPAELRHVFDPPGGGRPPLWPGKRGSERFVV